ncbi:hypothetical protein [Vannielia litorea]|uniref:Uncharacterized protein n=1 Tax=Vannielia litorea TaxID=1217970 RepID=A0A1N6HBM7_9RHOB|nr:hypothetical protein [Vannielia litorea]SIO17228.1 hypothetical protein SAMN05444002_3245 [Vannielia litorea]
MSTIIRRIALWAPVILVAWVAVMALVMRFSDAAPAAVVMLPSRAFLAALPPDAAILRQTAATITLKSDTPDFAARLYRAGALLVLPAGLTGCLPLPGALANKG